MAAQKKVILTMQQRLDVLEDLKTGNFSSVAVKYGVSTMTIRRIKENTGKIVRFSEESKQRKQRKYFRWAVHPELEQRLYAWFVERRTLGDDITDSSLVKKAKEIKSTIGSSPNFKASKGWLIKFKERHNIGVNKTHSEKSSPNVVACKEFTNEFQHRCLSDCETREERCFIRINEAVEGKIKEERYSVEIDEDAEGEIKERCSLYIDEAVEREIKEERCSVEIDEDVEGENKEDRCSREIYEDVEGEIKKEKCPIEIDEDVEGNESDNNVENRTYSNENQEELFKLQQPLQRGISVSEVQREELKDIFRRLESYNSYVSQSDRMYLEAMKVRYLGESTYE